MLHEIFLLRRKGPGGQIFEQQIQGTGALPAGLLADGGGYHTGAQHIQRGGNLIEGDDFGMAAGFLNGLASAKYTGGSKEQSIDVGILLEKLPGQRVAFKFIVMIFQNFRDVDSGIGGFQRFSQSADPLGMARWNAPRNFPPAPEGSRRSDIRTADPGNGSPACGAAG